ncbi:uncharacterized protein LOC115624174 [Scaptodrosophila lebanonensis]|uniref:Uncharacterized protein LOC115624174 n=1 Tax=Drosophila lebanonensis TaxID=7225 RepID=A0A6J2TGQ1_DROLE|nr:uncharacterized protein LOC115624174 [Scaptodrosophila lebanonensis]
MKKNMGVSFKFSAQPSGRHHFRYISEGLRGPLKSQKGKWPAVSLSCPKHFGKDIMIVCQLVKKMEGSEEYFVSGNTLQYIGQKEGYEKPRKRNERREINLNFEPVSAYMKVDSNNVYSTTFKFELENYCIVKSGYKEIRENLARLKAPITADLVQMPSDDVMLKKSGKDETVHLAFTTFIINGQKREKIADTIISQGILNASDMVRIDYCCNSELSVDGKTRIHLLLSDVKKNYLIRICEAEGEWKSAFIQPSEIIKSRRMVIYEAPKYDGPVSSKSIKCRLGLYDDNELLNDTDVAYVRYEIEKKQPVNIFSMVEICQLKMLSHFGTTGEFTDTYNIKQQWARNFKSRALQEPVNTFSIDKICQLKMLRHF